MDELTRQVLLEWLELPAHRWPYTANPHLLISQRARTEPALSAPSTSPRPPCAASPPPWSGCASTGSSQEALACGPDPLHLAAVFGLDPKTAIRYAGERQNAPGDRSRAARPRLMRARPPSDGPEPCPQTGGASHPVVPPPPGRLRVTQLHHAA